MSLVLWCIYVVVLGFPLYGGAVINSQLKTLGLLSTSLLGFTTGINPLIQGFMAPITAWILEKTSYRFAYLLGLGILLVGFLMLALLPYSNLVFVVAFGIFVSIGMGISGNYLVQTTLNNWFYEKKTMAFAISLSGGGMTGFILPPLMAKLIGGENWKWGWWVSVGAAVFAIILSYVFIKNKPEDVGQQISDEGGANGKEKLLVRYLRSRGREYSLKEAIRAPLYYGILINSIARYMSYYGVISHLLIHTQQRGLDVATGSLILSVLSLGNLSGRFIAGFVGEKRLLPQHSLLLAGITMTLATLLLAMPAGHVGLALGGLLTGFSLGFGSLMQAVAVSFSFGNKEFPKIYGSMTPIFNIGGAIGPILAGMMASFLGNYTLVLYLFTVFNLLSSVLLLFIHPQES